MPTETGTPTDGDSTSIEPEKDWILRMYEHAQKRRGMQIDRIWETMKHVTNLIFADIIGLAALLGYYGDRIPNLDGPVGKIPAVVLFPVFMLFVSTWALFNTRRQYSRFLETIRWINNAENRLGLTSLLPEEWRKMATKTETETIKDGLSFWKPRGSMLRHFTILYLLYSLLAGSLIFLFLKATWKDWCIILGLGTYTGIILLWYRVTGWERWKNKGQST